MHTDKLTETERLVVEYAQTLSMTPVAMTNDLERRVNDAFSPKQVVELTQVIAWENCRARFNRGFSIEPDGYTKVIPSIQLEQANAEP